MAQPLILAFDTSGPWIATALLRGDCLLASRYEAMAKGQAEALMPLIAATLAEHGLPLDMLDAIAVGVGPGNFTGIRISVSAARGLALALGIPAIGVSNFEVMRGPASCRNPGRQLVVLQGPRDSRYLQAFEGGRESGPPHLMHSPNDPFRDWIPITPETEILGHDAEALCLMHPPPHAAKGPPTVGRHLPTHDTGPTLARIAADKLARDTTHPRPAPLYVKPADAAPSRARGPVLL